MSAKPHCGYRTQAVDAAGEVVTLWCELEQGHDGACMFGHPRKIQLASPTGGRGRQRKGK